LTIAVDTNILLDILLADERFLQRSKENLIKAGESGKLVICEVVMAELSAAFFKRRKKENEILSFLSDLGIVFVPSSTESFFRAASAWNLYVSRREKDVICPECRKRFEIRCPDCGRIIALRQRIISDFLIGAHAVLHADNLLTRDKRVLWILLSRTPDSVLILDYTEHKNDTEFQSPLQYGHERCGTVIN